MIRDLKLRDERDYDKYKYLKREKERKREGGGEEFFSQIC